jgi:hypothetical protein
VSDAPSDLVSRGRAIFERLRAPHQPEAEVEGSEGSAEEAASTPALDHPDAIENPAPQSGNQRRRKIRLQHRQRPQNPMSECRTISAVRCRERSQ